MFSVSSLLIRLYNSFLSNNLSQSATIFTDAFCNRFILNQLASNDFLIVSKILIPFSNFPGFTGSTITVIKQMRSQSYNQ